MFVKVVGSSSKGNGYLFGDDEQQILIEAGTPIKETMKVNNYYISKIQAVVVSHEHGDHFKYHKQYEEYGIPVLCTWNSRRMNVYGKFVVVSFDVVHDGTDCCGVVIRYKNECIVYMSDLAYCKYTFKSMKPSVIMAECNYQKEYADKDEVKTEHVFRGHAEIQTTIGIIKENDNDNLKQIILIHASEGSLDKEEALEQVQKITDKPVCFAEKGMVIEWK